MLAADPAWSAEKAAAVLDEDERARAARLRLGVERRRFVQRRALRRHLLAGMLGVDAGGLRIAELCPLCGSSRHGKPYLPDAPGLHFSASQSGDRTVVAIGPAPLGVDVQLAGDDLLGAPDVFTPREAAALNRAPEAQGGQDALWRRAILWTRKEACLKAIGTGLAIDPAEVEALGASFVAGRFDPVRTSDAETMAASWMRGDAALSIACSEAFPVRFEAPEPF